MNRRGMETLKRPLPRTPEGWLVHEEQAEAILNHCEELLEG
jgi:hypothetical protein